MGLPKRGKRGIPIKRKVLVVCEGEKTEIHYFRRLNQLLRNTNVELKPIPGKKSQKELVKHAVGSLKKFKQTEIKSTWVIFDKDDLSNNVIQETFALAKQKNIKVGFTNLCFELWLLLHYELPNNFEKDKIERKLSQYLDEDSYDKCNEVQISTIAENYKSAIENNKKLYAKHNNEFITPFCNIFKVIEDFSTA